MTGLAGSTTTEPRKCPFDGHVNPTFYTRQFPLLVGLRRETEGQSRSSGCERGHDSIERIVGGGYAAPDRVNEVPPGGCPRDGNGWFAT